eukprot:Amastigsp_a509166_114.p2 type:complete len:151 gc:universal Amastigsp_a509166_114:167-619(+)
MRRHLEHGRRDLGGQRPAALGRRRPIRQNAPLGVLQNARRRRNVAFVFDAGCANRNHTRLINGLRGLGHKMLGPLCGQVHDRNHQLHSPIINLDNNLPCTGRQLDCRLRRRGRGESRAADSVRAHGASDLNDGGRQPELPTQPLKHSPKF